MAVSPVSFSKTPQAKDDLFANSLTEDSLKAVFDVMGNDLGGAAKKIYSLDNGDDDRDLLTRDAARIAGASSDFSSKGAKIWITDDGRVGYDAGALSARLQSLALGQSFEDSFTYAIQMGNGTISVAKVTIIIAGTNDGPEITSAAQGGAVNEDGIAGVSGQVTASDVDSGDHQLYSLPDGGAGTYGSLNLNAATGAWTYTLNNGAANVQALAQGEKHVEMFTVRVTDDFGASASQVVKVTVSGTNDGPQITSGDQTGATKEDEVAGATGKVTASDVDNGDHLHFAVLGGAGSFGSLAVNDTTGVWAYALDDGLPGVQALAKGESHIESFTVRVSDDFGAWADQAVNVTVTGTNDGPVAVADTAADAENQSQLINVLANDTDVDNGHVFTLVSVSESSGKGSVSISGNQLAFDPGADFDHLNVGHTETLTVSYDMTDEHGAASSSTASIVVVGVNDGPVVAGALSGNTNEDAAPLSFDLLAGATDVDDGFMLGAAGITETGGKGGWVIDGNVITIDPDYFGDDLDDGQFAHLDFSYQVVDEHGASVAQSLKVSIEGITDAPSLSVVTSAGQRVNEVMLEISSQPARSERVALTFSNVPQGAQIIDVSTGQEVSGGLPSYLGTRVFKLVLAADTDAYDDLSIAATGYRDDGSFIAAAVHSIDLAYDVVATTESLNFSSNNQNTWGDFPGYIDFHEYIPFVGGTPMVWDANAETWIDVASDYWRSGKFSLVDAQLDTNKIVDVARGQAKGVLDAAKAVFDATAYVIDSAVQATFNGAKTVFETAYNTFWYVARGVDQGVRDAFEWAKGEYGKAKKIYDDADYAFNVWAKGLYDTAETKWLGYKSWYDSLPQSGLPYSKDGENINIFTGIGPHWAEWKIAEAAYWVADGLWGTAKHAFETIATGTYNAALAVYNAAAAVVEKAATDTFNAAKTVFAEAERVYKEAKAWVLNEASKVYAAVQKGVDDTLAAITSKVDFKSQVTVQADVFAKAGLQVDVVLDLGSVDTSIDYQLTSTTQYNKTTDMLAITPLMANMTTGATVAFDTISPNAKFFVALHYDAGADFDVLLDGHLRIEGLTFYDLTPGSNAPIDLGQTISPKTAVADIQGLLTDAGLGALNLGGDLDVGKLVLVDFDSSKLEPFEVPFVGTLTEDVVSITLAFPTVVTEGTEAAYGRSYYEEGGLVAVDFSEITSAVLNLVNARLDYSPELREKIPTLGSLYDTQNFDQLVQQALKVVMGTLLDVLDGQSEEVPIFLIDATDETSTSLILANLWPDSNLTSTLNGNTASLGFYASYGESAPVVHINFDIDQAVALVVNEIVKAAINVASQGSTVSVLDAIPTINPLDLTLGLDTILKVLKFDKASRDAVGKFFDLNLNFQAADVDAHATTKFSQEFTLSVDDMSYLVTLEDGEQQVFTANGAGELLITDASSHDANGDGSVAYSLEIVPTAMFSNDTELGFGVGYTLDFMKGSLGAGIKLPLGELLGINSDWLTVEIPLVDVALGPLLRVQGDLDVLDVDVFETRFGLDLGSDTFAGAVDLELVGVNNALV